MEYHTLHVDSVDRSYDAYPNPNSYVITLPKTYYNVVEARLLTAEFPNSFYVFRAAANTTTIRVALDATSADVTIPDGNYNDVTIAEALVDALEVAFPGETFTVAVDEVTLALTIECTSSPAATVSIDTTVHCDASKRTNWGLGYYLGFEPSAVSSGTGGVTSPRVVSLNPYTYFMLDITELNGADEYGMMKTFCKIPVDVSSFGYMYYNATSFGAPAVRPHNSRIARLTQLTVSVRFHDGTPVDFNDVEHSFSIVLGCVPRGSSMPVVEPAPIPPPSPVVVSTKPRKRATSPKPRKPNVPAEKSSSSNVTKLVGGAMLVAAAAGAYVFIVRREVT